ncbi:hypothetical protein CU788_19760 [Salmonella enterica]|nr:hypothetical protein [Salmonella enterica]EGW2853013.1 hypothetical protein [Salmonella enterica]
MKKIVYALTSLALVVTGNTCAASPQDQSLTLNITGQITGKSQPTAAACAVVPDNSGDVLLYTADESTMINQGESGTNMNKIGLHVYGVQNISDCSDIIQEGRIALKFIGQQDNAEGSVLANTGTATGVGIGLYDYNSRSPIAINTGTLAIDKNTTTWLGLQSVKLSGQEAKMGSMKGALTVEIERL